MSFYSLSLVLYPRKDIRREYKHVNPPASSAPPSQRLLSLDALRGFTMFWLIGGREFAIAAAACVNTSLADAVETQLTHPHWDGFVAWDTIMPMFLFMVGTSMPFAFGKRLMQEVSKGTMYRRIIRRVILLWILGMIAQGLLKNSLSNIELFSNTLQAIAVGYLITSIALLHLSLIGQIGLFAALVLGYWIMLTFIPFAGHPGGTLTQTVNFPRYIDELILGQFRRHHDFTWIITSMGFSATVLLGAMAGQLLRGRLPAKWKLIIMVAVGYLCLVAGWLWSYWLPLNRHLWTSSMVIWTGGLCFLYLALFYAVIDMLGAKAWAFFFVVIGANALFAYMFDEVIGRTVSDTFVLQISKLLPTSYGDLLCSVAETAVLWSILFFLYRKQSFFRV
jgi:predicted acyltransferase